jgi:tetratricopeptide (TPR) repeat protein
LLRPDRATVPFTGRGAELDELRAWCTSEPARAVRVLYGEAGVGKTRLALETAARHHADGGESRLVPVGQEADAVRAARARTAGRLLLVVDRAETRSGLEELLRSMPDDPGPVRVLLVARVLGEWWDRLASTSEPAVSRLLTGTEPLQLTVGVSEDASDADLAKAALPHFAHALSVAAPRQVTIAPGDRRMPLLVLHAAALVALLRFYTYPVATLRVVISEDALDELLEHESRYWLRSASAAGLPAGAALVKQVLAASALLGAASTEEASDVMARVPGLGDRPAGERLRWAQWLEELYPADGYGSLGVIQPEMMAETHVAGQLADDPDLARSCLRGLPTERAEHALAVLARAWAHRDGVRTIIVAALRDDLAGLGVPAGRVALQAQGDLGGLLADALDDTPAPAEVLANVALNIPYPSKVLARAHLAATERVRESLPADTKPETVAEWDARAARLLSELGRDAGRQPARPEASPRRPISWASPARAHPDQNGSPAGPAAAPADDAPSPAATPTASAATAAAAVTSASATTAAAATPPHRTDSRTAARETTASSADHAAAASPATRAAPRATPPLPADRRTSDRDTTNRDSTDRDSTTRAPAASSATPAAEPAQSGRPGKRERGASTDKSTRKTAKRQRAGSQADRSRARPGPGGSAASTTSTSAKPAPSTRRPGRRAADQETASAGRASAAKPAKAAAQPPRPTRREDPAKEYLEAVAAYRELAGANPGKYRADLARALTNLGLRLSELRRPDEALQAGQEALTILRELNEADPDRFRAELATCLVSLGIWHSERGRADDALKAEQEAVSIRRELVANDPARYRSDLAASLANLGITLSRLGRPGAALGPVREAVAIYRDLARTDPKRYRPDLARCLANLGIRYAEIGRPAEALSPTEEAVTIRRELARVNPDRYRPDLARSLVNLGIRHSELGQATDAMLIEQEAVNLYRELAAASPGYRRELARALRELAAAFGALWHGAEAAERAESEAAEIMRDLEQPRTSGARLARPGDRDWPPGPPGSPGQAEAHLRS